MEQLLEYIKEYEEVNGFNNPGTLTYNKSNIYIFGTDIKFAGSYLASLRYGFVGWMVRHHPGKYFNDRIKVVGYPERVHDSNYGIKERCKEFNMITCAYIQIANSYDPVSELKYLFSI